MPVNFSRLCRRCALPPVSSCNVPAVSVDKFRIKVPQQAGETARKRCWTNRRLDPPRHIWKLPSTTVGEYWSNVLTRHQQNNKSHTCSATLRNPHRNLQTEAYMISSARELHHHFSSRVGVRLKVGDKFWEEWRGAVWGGAVPSPVGGLGACPQKKKQFHAKNYAILSKFWYFFPILQHKRGIIPQS